MLNNFVILRLADDFNLLMSLRFHFGISFVNIFEERGIPLGFYVQF